MKRLIRRLSRVADSSHSQYCRLSSDSSKSSRRSRRAESAKKMRRRSGVAAGHVPVYVGEEKERFVVRAEMLNHPVFIGLLNRSAQEYGYEQKGGLRIPCPVLLFERLLESLRLGHHDSHSHLDLLLHAALSLEVDDSSCSS